MDKVGFGYDVHKFSDEVIKSSSVFLCGVEIAHDRSVVSNSDGDVAIHALVDAILGALADNDIGHYFSPNDSKWQSYNSSHFLLFAGDKLQKAGYKINNLDITIVCERPKIAQHRDRMRDSISQILKIGVDVVSIKGKTTEGLGFAGRREGIAAYAVVMISPSC